MQHLVNPGYGQRFIFFCFCLSKNQGSNYLFISDTRIFIDQFHQLGGIEECFKLPQLEFPNTRKYCMVYSLTLFALRYKRIVTLNIFTDSLKSRSQLLNHVFVVKPTAYCFMSGTYGKVFKNGPSEICGRKPLKNLKRYGLLKQRLSSTNFTRSILEYFVPYETCSDQSPSFVEVNQPSRNMDCLFTFRYFT